MDDPYAYTHLYRKFLQGTCTPDEVRVLLQQFGQEEVDPRLAEAVAKALAASDDVDEATRQRARAIVAKSDGFIYDHIVLPNQPTPQPQPAPQPQPTPRTRTLRWIPYAAAAVLICAIGVFAYFGWPPAQTAGTATAKKGVGWAGLLYDVAKEGLFGDVEKTDKTGLFDVFVYLYKRHHDNKELERKYKSARK